ncbi:flavin-containing monooxygenase [Aspergillus aculeatinus CBS 121060]|uniref:Monooxygenase n=1 Tax=Aspergillus aculeatinus CBS 121060 TaxID=1448322 RepID=A0ACD1H1M2_9EURO|nr:monooxygenase [Aspergillus aculeatinus CBS 121060]RAH67444.1 monooxygenase [Aspergillus aculeatinus CBS 121060]
MIQVEFEVVVIGAGISGIQIAHDVTSRMKNIDLKIYDKNESAGGTWFENRYPGCACDVPSHGYQYSWAPNPCWSTLYASAPEICAYLDSVIADHGLAKYIRLQQRCVSATWDERNSSWITTFKHETTQEETVVEADVLVYAVGRLNNYKLPDFHGRAGFRGDICHTACCLGNGSSGMQCVGALQYGAEAAELINFCRSQTWAGPGLFDENKRFTEEEKLEFANNPDLYHKYRTQLERQIASAFRVLWKNTPAHHEMRARVESYYDHKIQDPNLRRMLQPDFAPACRRWTIGDSYIEAMQQPHVHLVQDHVASLTETGVRTCSGEEYDCDLVVCATGFEPYASRFPVIGRDGISLNDCWGPQGDCESYMASMVAGFPNLFAFHPPHCPVNGSVIPGIERTSDYIIRILTRLQTDCLRSVSVKPEAQHQFVRWAQSRMPYMSWSDPCSSWYKNKEGRVVVPWPGTNHHYYAATEIVRWEDFDLRFEDPTQKYASFGNGVTEDGFAPEFIPWVLTPEGQQGSKTQIRT